MQHWKARILMLLSTMAMVLALSMPVVAQAQSCPPWDEDCDSSEDCPPWDENCDSSEEDDYYGDDYYGDDYYGDDYYDTFEVGGAYCVAFFDDDGDGYDEDGDGYDQDADGYEDVVCFDDYGNVVYES